MKVGDRVRFVAEVEGVYRLPHNPLPLRAAATPLPAGTLGTVEHVTPDGSLLGVEYAPGSVIWVNPRIVEPIPQVEE